MSITFSRKLLHERATANRSYNAPTIARALKERAVLDKIVGKGKLYHSCYVLFIIYVIFFSLNFIKNKNHIYKIACFRDRKSPEPE